MSRLEELIQQLCPDGVEYKTIGEIAVDIFRGSGIKREQVTETGIPCVRYGELYTTYGVWFDTCVSHTDESAITSKKYFEHGDILFAITGESVEDIAKCSAYIGYERCLAGGDIVVLRHNQDPKYLSYALSTTEAKKQKSKGKVKSKVVHSSVPAIKELIVPIPPLEVQQEIVRILDQFTELTAELTTQLTAELTARKKQYEYYQTLMLEFNNSVTWAPLGEIANITDYVANGSFASLRENVSYSHEPDFAVLIRTADYSTNFDPENMIYIDKHAYEFLAKSKLFGGEIIINNIGAGVGTTFRCPNLNMPMSLAPNSVIVSTDDDDFYYHWFISQWGQDSIRKIVSKSAMPKFNKTGLRSIKVPVPTKDVRERIVDILDRFDALCNDLTSGLPAEIQARQKQYEYYRDKLLTFQKKASDSFRGE